MRWCLRVLAAATVLTTCLSACDAAPEVDRSELPPPPAPKTRPGEMFKECDVCPEMVVVPAGSFIMGSPATEARRDSDEAQHPVTIARPFAVGRFEVTFAQWNACVSAGGCAPPEEMYPSQPDEGYGRDDHPVINVSWQDAKRYVRWLNRRVGGKAYRLLSEAEWEYAARGRANGTANDTPYPWGPTASHENANYGTDQCCDGLASGRDQWVNAAPVGSFPANAFGISDMHGNVWEWVEDCYVADNAALTREGAANTIQGCSSYRVLRGGGWHDISENLRSAERDRIILTLRYSFMGFRLARTVLTP